MTARERAAAATGFALGARAMRDMLMSAPSLRSVRAAIGAVTDEWIDSAIAEVLCATAPTPADASPYATSTPGLATERDRRIVADLHRFAGRPTPADALAQDAAESAAEDEMVSNVKDRVFGGLLAQLEEDDIERMRRGA